jgi:hypothetical protein
MAFWFRIERPAVVVNIFVAVVVGTGTVVATVVVSGIVFDVVVTAIGPTTFWLLLKTLDNFSLS